MAEDSVGGDVVLMGRLGHAFFKLYSALSQVGALLAVVVST